MPVKAYDRLIGALAHLEPSAAARSMWITCKNRRGQLLASPFCVRPLPGAPVSTPLDWSEVNRRLDPKKFDIRTVPRRMQKLGRDPLLPVLDAKPDLVGILARRWERLDAGLATQNCKTASCPSSKVTVVRSRTLHSLSKSRPCSARSVTVCRPRAASGRCLARSRPTGSIGRLRKAGRRAARLTMFDRDSRVAGSQEKNGTAQRISARATLWKSVAGRLVINWRFTRREYSAVFGEHRAQRQPSEGIEWLQGVPW